MKNSFVIYHDYEDKLRMLSDEQMGKLWRMIFKYEKTGEVTDSDDAVIMMAFSFIKNDLDINRQKYETKVNNGKLGGRPKNQTKPNETKSNLTKPKQTDNVNVNDNENVNDKNKRAFSKPSLDDVQSYIVDMNMRVDAQSFIDYYESNGWRVGRNPMKDWKATLRRWNKNPIHKGKDIPSYMTTQSESEIADASDVADVKSMIENLKA